jgi:hypothetical protein
VGCFGWLVGWLVEVAGRYSNPIAELIKIVAVRSKGTSN